jgi:hypothetical protein
MSKKKLPTCLCCIGREQLNPNWTCSVCDTRMRVDAWNNENPYCGDHRDHYFLNEHCRYCVFCSEQCRDLALQRRAARQRRRSGQPIPDTICAVCGNPFTARRFDALTCSPACRQKQYRRRKSVTENDAGPNVASGASVTPELTRELCRNDGKNFAVTHPAAAANAAAATSVTHPPDDPGIMPDIPDFLLRRPAPTAALSQRRESK